MADVTEVAPRQFELALQGHGLCRGEGAAEVTVSAMAAGQRVQVFPPGTALDKDDDAALALLAAALVTSLLMQIRRVAAAQDIPLGTVITDAAFIWRSTRIGAAPHQARLDDVQIDISIDAESSASEGRLLQLVDSARQSCLIQQTILRANRISHRLRRPGGWTSF